ncbi:MAG: hypothetical protein ACTSWY_16115 [Promethearchaeota archaeon]
MSDLINQNKNIINILSNTLKTINPKFKSGKVIPVLEHAMNNFELEMNSSIQDINAVAPHEMKAHIFEILTKHFITCLLNEDYFIKSDISKNTLQIEREINKSFQMNPIL